MRIPYAQRRITKVYPTRRYIARLIDGLILAIPTVAVLDIMLNNLGQETLAYAVLVSIKAIWLLVTDGWAGASGATIDGTHEYWIGLVQSITAVLALVVVMMTLYEWLGHARYGRTIGKAIVGIKVISLSSAAEPESSQRLTGWQSARRAGVTVLLPGTGWVILTFAASSLDPVIAGIGTVLILSYWIDVAALLLPYNGMRRCLHDLVSGTTVVPARYGNQRLLATTRVRSNS